MEVFSRIISLLLILVLSPFIFIIVIFSYIFQGFPIFFKQKRIGYKYQIFEIYKFRTMQQNSGSSITVLKDNRITKFGRILRKTKIDEIPQLFNILKGDMRFIGPRPEVQAYFNKNSFKFLEKIKPGISDFSSIIFRNEDIILDSISGEKPYNKLLPIKLELAYYYAKKKTFLLDLKLTLITIISIGFPEFCSKKIIIPQISKDLPSVKVFLKKYVYS